MSEEGKCCQPQVVPFACGGSELECTSRGKDKNGAVEECFVLGRRAVVGDIENRLNDDWRYVSIDKFVTSLETHVCDHSSPSTQSQWLAAYYSTEWLFRMAKSRPSAYALHHGWPMKPLLRRD